MGLSLNSNVASLQTQRALGSATSSLDSVYQRLSSGQRINNASDDAAGLSVSASLNSNGRILTIGRRNTNDAISLISIADSALDQQGQILQRLQEIAEQSANGSYNDVQRSAMQTEYGQLINEFGRIGQTTSFNGVKPLDASRQSSNSQIVFQVGADGKATSQISVATADTGNLSGTLTSESFGMPYDGVISSADNGKITIALTNPSATFPNGFRYDTIDSQGKIQQFYIAALDYSSDGSGLGSAYTGGDPYVYFAVFNRDSLSAGWSKVTGLGSPPSSFSVGFNLNSGAILAGQETFSRTVTLSGGQTSQINLDFTALKFKFTGSQTNLEFSNVTTTSAAISALGVVGNRQTELQQIRGAYGASSSRLNVAGQVAGTAVEQYAAAASRIKDTDIAADSAELIRLNILQRTGSALLAQVNQAPALALQLLRGN